MRFFQSRRVNAGLGDLGQVQVAVVQDERAVQQVGPQFEKEAKLKLSNPLNSVIPVNDFMDTQYLAEVRIGSPA